MPKNSKKHSKAAQPPSDDSIVIEAPMDQVIEVGEKDEEERRLESFLFDHHIELGGETGSSSDDERELENFHDKDLFYFDEAPRLAATDEPQRTPLVALQASRHQEAAWIDSDEEGVSVSLNADKRLRKLRNAPEEETLAGREYEGRLRRQFENIHPTPEWANLARKKRRKAADDDTEDPVQKLVSSTAGIVSSTRSATLPQHTLAIDRLRDANQSEKTEGEVKAVMFHPSPSVPVLLVAGSDRRLRLFNIDGHTNPKLQTLHIPELPFSSAVFHPSGSNILLTGPRPFYYKYDLQSGSCLRSPRGLWGSLSDTASSMADLSMEITAFSPAGDLLAVAGRRGHVYLVDWKAGGAQVVGNVKMNAGVKALWWKSGSGGAGGIHHLFTLGEDSQVYEWDARAQRCLHRWKDDGGFGGCVMAGDSAGKYLGIGSTTGFVNVYDSSSVSLIGKDPLPLKTLGHLTTTISSLRFNHDSQLLAFASRTKKDQLRLVHLPSLTAMSNWPTSGTPLGVVNALDFSPRSEYLAVGNNRGRVLLWNLGHYVHPS